MSTPVTEPTSSDEVAPEKKSLLLNAAERWFAAASGAIVAVVAIVLVFAPPDRETKTTVVGGTTPDVVTTVTTAADLTTVVTALVAFAVVAFVLAIVGVRFTSFEIAGQKFSASVEEVPEPDKEEEGDDGDDSHTPTPSATATQRNLLPREVDRAKSEAVWNGLDDWVKTALLTWLNGEQERLTKPVAQSILRADKERGRGNHPWYISLLDDNGDAFKLRVATGKGSATTREQ